jgi:type II secretory pathway pseudopilin PulG
MPTPPSRQRRHAAAGFSLLEVLIATTMLAAGLLALAQLFLVAAASNRDALHATRAVLLAQQQAEWLRACCTVPAVASPPAALQDDIPGYVDYLDGHGATLGGGPPAPAGTVYTRRWSLEPLPSHPGAASILQVLVTPHRTPVSNASEVGRRPGEARIVTLLLRNTP